MHQAWQVLVHFLTVGWHGTNRSVVGSTPTLSLLCARSSTLCIAAAMPVAPLMRYTAAQGHGISWGQLSLHKGSSVLQGQAIRAQSKQRPSFMLNQHAVETPLHRWWWYQQSFAFCCCCWSCCAGSGAMFGWDIAQLPPQERTRHSSRALGGDGYDPDDEDDGDDSEDCYIGEPHRYTS